MLNAFTNELPAKKQQFADNDPKKAAYDAAIKNMKEAFTAAEKNDWNAVNNAVSNSIFRINKSGVYDKSFEEYAGNFMRNISEFRKQPATTKPTDGGDQKYWDDKAKWQAGQKPDATTPAKPVGIPYRKDVEIAQQQLANMGGFDLGTSGRYGNGVDGKLGDKTRKALKQYNPNISPEQAIKELNRAYAAGPTPVKQELEDLPKPEVSTTPGVRKTWGV
jgi:hypothetical protein